jgi:putative transposase
MPSGLRRLHGGGQGHYLTFSCYKRQPYLAAPETRDAFERKLEQTRAKFDFIISAYVIMPEHVHLLLSEPRIGQFADAIHWMKLSFSKSMRKGRFWQERGFDFNIFTEKKWAEKVVYIHLNPVRRKLVARAQDWRWSSAGAYETLQCGAVRIHSIHEARQDPKLNLDKALGNPQYPGKSSPGSPEGDHKL